MEQTKLISFELTSKVRRNVEKSYQTRWLQMHYSREKHCQHTKIQRQVEETLRLIKYATTNVRRNVIRQNQVRQNVFNIRRNVYEATQ